MTARLTSTSSTATVHGSRAARWDGGGTRSKPAESGGAAHTHLLPAQPAAIPVNAAPRQRLPGVLEALQSPGEPLDEQTRAFVEPRFGRDFSAVRLHTDTQASDSASAVNALAYTAGNHIVFNRGRYAPGTVSGRRLLIHELTHVAQQGSQPAPPESDWRLGSPASAAESSADTALRSIENGLRVSPAQLASPLTGSAPVVRRAISTWGGEWDTARYEAFPARVGLEMELHFKPGAEVNATRIGIVQKVVTTSGGVPISTGDTYKARSVPKGNSGAGGAIDQKPEATNPLYVAGSGKPGDTLGNTPADTADPAKSFGQYGFHYQDEQGKQRADDAILNDRPHLRPVKGVEMSQTFEDTALAVRGVQQGATYGSVQWGWKIDAQGAFTKLPLTRLSDDVPTKEFKQAEQSWNKSKNSAGKDDIQFHTPTQQFIQEDQAVMLMADAKAPLSTRKERLARNTRVEVIPKELWETGDWAKLNRDNPGAERVKVTVIDGPSAGKTGWVLASQLANTRSKAAASSPAP